MATNNYTVTHHEATIDVPALIDRYRDIDRFVGLCTACNSYNKVWGCPPYAEHYAARLLDPYHQAVIHGTRISFDVAPSATELKAAIAAVWDELLPRLYALEREHPGSRIFTGRCRLCGDTPCSRAEGAPCRHPHEMRHSLEAVGFDVVAIAHDLLGIDLEWGTGGAMPRTITLVTALFTR